MTAAKDQGPLPESAMIAQGLTKLEREMLRRSGEFVLAGEWPWKELRTWEREKAALISAVTKMEHGQEGGR